MVVVGQALLYSLYSLSGTGRECICGVLWSEILRYSTDVIWSTGFLAFRTLVVVPPETFMKIHSVASFYSYCAASAQRNKKRDIDKRTKEEINVRREKYEASFCPFCFAAASAQFQK